MAIFFSLLIITGFVLGAFCGGLCEKSCFSLRDRSYGHLKDDCVFQSLKDEDWREYNLHGLQ